MSHWHTPASAGRSERFVVEHETGRARLVDESQDDLISSANPATLAAGSTWKRYGITCTLAASSVRCTNGTGHGFKISTGRLSLF